MDLSSMFMVPLFSLITRNDLTKVRRNGKRRGWTAEGLTTSDNKYSWKTIKCALTKRKCFSKPRGDRGPGAREVSCQCWAPLGRESH